ncbi:uncharacterized protein At4g15970 isoform X1 [Dioscorea cayenensis subsp. rotundata]|uniref:Uncharacterized protein At4g15970 isoform X1 n=1 Tax=Dioscorea cayennensis subsp. rotundata TaxID=55577 RepID=A0AB40D2V7_DIOCR|nr:uncharacterized protein At4g15970 isoform X1 [Dioscorea cayenensis subsp. rotundata]
MGKPFAVSGKRSPRSPTAGGAGSSWKTTGRCLTFLLLLAAVAFPTVVLYRAVDHRHYSYRSLRSDLNASALLSDSDWLSEAAAQDTVELRLDKILQEASMEDKTVILTTLNSAWARSGSVVDLFIESFRIGIGTRVLLNHLVIITLDPKAYERCLLLHTHCFPLATEGIDFSGEEYFMSNGYLEMMWRRIDFLRTILEMGYSFIFTDVDIMWFRNPLPNFYSDVDFQTACDHFFGNSTDLGNRANGGFNYVKSNNRSIEFYKYWYSSRERFPGHHDQDVFNTIKYDPFVTEIGLTMRFLSTTFFGGLCEPSRDLNKVCTMHANCCIGLESKLHDLRIMLDNWREFMSLPHNMKNSGIVSWRVPQNCSIAALFRTPSF